MKKEKSLNQETDYFSAQMDDEVIILTLKGNFLLVPSLLSAKRALLAYLEQVEKNESVKVVVVKGASQREQQQDYLDFFGMLSKSQISEGSLDRMFQTYNHLIMKMITSQKFFIYVHSGKEIFQSLNLSCAADYRMATTNTVFLNPSVKLGLTTKGGGAYFLKKTVGHQKAFEMLLTTHKLGAQEALKLGLLDKVVPTTRLRDVVLKTAHKIGKQPATSLSLIKKLLNHDAEELRAFLEKESAALHFTWARMKGLGMV